MKCPKCHKHACICDELEDKQYTFEHRFQTDVRRRKTELKKRKEEKRKQKNG